MTESAALRWSIRVLVGTLVLGTALVLITSVPYFLPGSAHPFLTERPQLQGSGFWRGSLRVHVLAGMFCLPAGIFLLAKPAQARWPRVHGGLGRLYVATMILVMFPTGLILARFAKGGPAAGLGFLLSNLVATAACVHAVRVVARGDGAAHGVWMLRSYAQVSSAITFRIYHLVLQVVGAPYETNYVTSLWLSVLGNALIAEALVRIRDDGRSASTERSQHRAQTDPPCDLRSPALVEARPGGRCPT